MPKAGTLFLASTVCEGTLDQVFRNAFRANISYIAFSVKGIRIRVKIDRTMLDDELLMRLSIIRRIWMMTWVNGKGTNM
ncbi:hypothetical protein OnM2_024119 [Erysiphe neolycopersici]|uniref:Uncharacterized protein n=1 Tax=Erysiphe neolycopersici TaxID=212602 RepID=A0A420I222_9PEZI|nr:hypothetical protein OnM2_024119 [Erysiphe neolycopersici]